MNLNFCRFKCGRSWHPKEIVKGTLGWYLIMNDRQNSADLDACVCVEIEDASWMFENPPKGWYKVGCDSLVFEEGDAEDSMWGIRLIGGDCSCRFMAEQTMYDIRHERRLAEWREREQRRLALIEKRRNSNAGQQDS